MKNVGDIRVLVLCGGNSTEREVSLRSGAAVHKALQEVGFKAEILDINGQNVREIFENKPDVVYIALHGKGGEDGSIQGLLEYLNIPYTGPGVMASAICMDKAVTKDILIGRGVKTPKYAVIAASDSEKYDKERICCEFGLPVVIKASCQGSSIGVEIVSDADRIDGAISDALTFGDSVLIEQFVKGVELSVPIIGNDTIEALPIIEIVSENKFYDYQSKYTPGMSHHIIPARISEEVRAAVEAEAVKAYLATGCRGISRVDVIVGDDGIPYVIEINTSPGMTATSLVPDAARHAGMTFGELAKRVVSFALEK